MQGIHGFDYHSKHELNDQELYLQAKRDKKRAEKEKRKEIQDMLEDPSMVGNDGHFNLFINEEFEAKEKDRINTDLANNRTKEANIYLKRTANLGEFFDTNSKPWYSNRNKQLSKFEETCVQGDAFAGKREVQTMLKIGTALLCRGLASDLWL